MADRVEQCADGKVGHAELTTVLPPSPDL